MVDAYVKDSGHRYIHTYMESQEVVERRDLNGSVGTSGGNGLEVEQVNTHGTVDDNLNVDFVDDLDSYLEDINDCLIISRMVSDTVIKGMVNAVVQEAADKTAAKESEIASLRLSLHFLCAVGYETESSCSSLMHHGPQNVDFGMHWSFPDAIIKHDKMRESLQISRRAVGNQFERLKKEIEGVKGCSSFRRIGSGSELVGLGGILNGKETESWVGVDRTVNSLEMTTNSIYTQVDDMIQLSKTMISEWQQEQDLKGELEALVMQSSIRCLQEEFEKKLWNQNACLCSRQNVDWVQKANEISGLRKDLDVFLKTLSSPDYGHLSSQGSLDMDDSYGKAFSTSLWEANGKANDSKSGLPENFDAAQLKHLSNDALVNYFNTTISKIKREHESTVQGMTEKYISLRGKYLNERWTLALAKDKDFEVFRKKIPEVVLKLDNILVESENLPAFGDIAESFGRMRDRLDKLLAENRQLRDSLTDMKNEVKCLSSQVSGASEKMLQHSSAEANLQKVIRNLKSSLANSCIEASVIEEVYKCVLGELNGQIKSITEESELELLAMQEIYGVILREFAASAEPISTYAIEDSGIESMIIHGLSETVFLETLKDAERNFDDLFKECLTANESRVSLEMKAAEKEDDLRVVVEENKKLRQEVNSLAQLKEEKERLASEISTALKKEREQFELASEELNHLREHASEQQTLMSKTSEEFDVINAKLAEALKKNEADQMEISSLSQKLEVAMEELKVLADEHRNAVLALSQEKAKEKEHREQMKAVFALVDELSKRLANFECWVEGDMRKNNLRLENSRSQLVSLIKAVNILKNTGIVYKQKLEKRCSDLQMAEAEVDLLGDEVDTLLSLLEKIYIALDHYSPVLQHYPGVMEILQLVRRELSGESIKLL